jgi:hypothetical protein
MQSLWIIIIVLSQPVFGDAVQILISSKFDLFTSTACGLSNFLCWSCQLLRHFPAAVVLQLVLTVNHLELL